MHIVCLDAPSPPDYGGAIDMFYKIVALSTIGVGIHLHYFDYRPGRDASGLSKYCVSINCYHRKTGIRGFLPSLPYIVSSRINMQLVKRLNEDDYPILLEGLHSTGVLPSLLPGRKLIIRQHNEEPVYYAQLSRWETNFVKKLYYRLESKLLNRYQSGLSKKLALACLSQKDLGQFVNGYGFLNAHFIPCFIPWQVLKVQAGRGSFCLYHGNMRIRENEEAAAWLIRNVFSASRFQLVIAGNGISPALVNLAKECDNISFMTDPSLNALDKLIRDAHIHVLPSFNSTGVKLKLLHALIEGRFCITNRAGVDGSGLETLVKISEEPDEWLRLIGDLMEQEVNIAELENRKMILDLYDNNKNAEKLTGLW